MVESLSNMIVPLDEYDTCQEYLVGGKGAKLSRLMRAGFVIPQGFCISVDGYRSFVERNNLSSKIKMELGRKSLSDMRWEELWDAALRIRSAFLTGEMPETLSEKIAAAAGVFPKDVNLAVRSSAVDEDSVGLSFAGLHESVVNVRGLEDLLQSIRVVWASLWSDAALLYRTEMKLNADDSAMAVVVQSMIPGGPSGVAFGRDPRNIARNSALIEAVPGQNSELVDGLVDPDRWTLARDSGEILDQRSGQRDSTPADGPMLETDDLKLLLDRLLAVEGLFGWPADMEWTGRGERLTLLQARPITSGQDEDDNEERRWYLSLRPQRGQLRTLAERVSRELIPELMSIGEQLAAQRISTLSDRELADAIKERLETVARWRQIYTDDFIPLAHGVRQLGIYYNNAVQPDDPYEFTGLLEGEEMIAGRRNQVLGELAEMVCSDYVLNHVLSDIVRQRGSEVMEDLTDLRVRLARSDSGSIFIEKLEHLLGSLTDVDFGGTRLGENPQVYIHTILELADARGVKKTDVRKDSVAELRSALEERLFAAVGNDQRDQAAEIVEIGRLSWRLRDDDNMLMGRLESQLLRAAKEAARRLSERGLLEKYRALNADASRILADSLVDTPADKISLPEDLEPDKGSLLLKEGKPRQLVGQPAGPGIATGTACVVGKPDDLMNVRHGQVLVCDAIQPNMTHIVPLVSAIVERRGGMLIHGAIIARELKIPCVNGVADAVNLIENDELVVVDGYLGIVTVGPPEFDLEKIG